MRHKAVPYDDSAWMHELVMFHVAILYDTRHCYKVCKAWSLEAVEFRGSYDFYDQLGFHDFRVRLVSKMHGSSLGFLGFHLWNGLHVNDQACNMQCPTNQYIGLSWGQMVIIKIGGYFITNSEVTALLLELMVRQSLGMILKLISLMLHELVDPTWPSYEQSSRIDIPSAKFWVKLRDCIGKLKASHAWHWTTGLHWEIDIRWSGFGKLKASNLGNWAQ